MWILLRIFAALLGALFRHFAANARLTTTDRIGRIEYAAIRTKNDSGETTSHCIAVPLVGNVCFVITRETRMDRLFKLLGFSREFQTGDRKFDRRIYIASDHPEFCEALRDNARLRRLVTDMLAAGIDRIWSNGHMLFTRAKKKLDLAVLVPRLDRIRSEIALAIENATNRFDDPFVWRALVVECIVWSMAGYAAVAVVDYWFHDGDHYLDRGRLLTYGAICAGIAVFGLLVAIVLFLKRTSRSHRILVESAVLLTLSTPVFGVQLVADVDRASVTSPPVVVRARVTRHWEKSRWSRKRGRWYSYHMDVSHIAGEVPISGEIDVSRDVYRTLSDGSEIPIEIGRGRLGLRWYKSINGVPVAQ